MSPSLFYIQGFEEESLPFSSFSFVFMEPEEEEEEGSPPNNDD